MDRRRRLAGPDRISRDLRARLAAAPGLLGLMSTCVGRWHSRSYLVAVLVLGVPYTVADYGVVERVLWFLWTFLIPGLIAYALGRGFRRSRVERRRQEERLEEQQVARDRALQDQKRHIARDLHDIVAHDLTVISMHAQALDVDSADRLTRAALETIGASSSRALQDLRRLLDVLDDEGLIDAEPSDAAVIHLEDELQRCSATLQDLGFRVECDVQGNLDGLPQSLQTALSRILQECTTNVIKHGAADRDGLASPDSEPDCVVLLDASSYEVTLAVSNRVPQSPRPCDGGGLGLVSLAERVDQLGGRFAAGLREGGRWEARAESISICRYEK
ncbi:hypothetical protein BCY76_011820 [Nesterenkonia sp. PF2B19]|nr:hypothetical protein BCY76_011820 [Nesterenkonia sp. PF2B19]